MDSPHKDPLDTAGCEAEPIRYPGSVQPHGMLLVLNPVGGVIEAASESSNHLMGRCAEELLGQTLTNVLGADAQQALMGDDSDCLQPLCALTLNGHPFTARTLHNANGQYLIDIESATCGTGSPERLRYNIRSGLEALRRLDDSTHICQAGAQLIGKLTGFDQVMIYRFDAYWNGEVIAEAVAPGIEPYLGLHFPASDIPQQARELFKVCRVRMIADVHYSPSALVARNDARSIDLGLSSLRSVSPLHIQYLKNMGTRATLVAALVIEDRLWGLVSCQQKNEAHYFNQAERDALGWLCQDLAALLEARLARERNAHEHSLVARRQKLINAVRSLRFSELMRDHHNADLLGVVGADGFALLVDGVIQTTGATPGLERICELNRRRTEMHPTSALYASHALVQDLGPGPGDADVAGALFVTVLRQPVVTMVWFRRERRHTLAWGGDPTHAHLPVAGGGLTPRTSFQTYLQEVCGQSQAWSPEEMQSATELVALVEIEALRNSEAFSKTILDSMTEHISVLDDQGVVVTVNDAWKRFAADNGGTALVQSPIGMSYRDICMGAANRPGGDEAAAAWAGIEGVLKRTRAYFSMDYPCDSPSQKRWFRMNAYPMQSPLVGTIVLHENITARKTAEIARDHSEAHLKSAQQIASLGSWAWDMATGESRWSDQQYRILGCTPGSVHPGYDVFIQAVHPDDRAKVQSAIEKTIARAVAYSVECRIVQPDGSVRHIFCQGEVERDAQGRTKGLAGTILDITERVVTQMHLEKLLAEQKALLENELCGIMEARERKVVWANPAFEKVLGYGAGELVGMDTRNFYPSEDAYQAFGAAAYAQLAQHKVYRAETEYVRKDGEHIWVEASGAMLDATSGLSLWCTVDITERKRSAESLRESEERFRSMADSAPALIWITGVDGLCLWFNKVWLDFTGRTMEQEAGNGWTEGVHPDDVDQCLDTYSTAFDARQEFAMEYRLRRFDGQYRWLMDSGVPRRDEAGNFLGYIGSCIDITKRKDAQIQIEQLLDEQRAILASDLVGIVKVEHRTIQWSNAALNRMLGYAEGELNGRPTRELYPSHAAYAAFSQDELVRLQSGETVRRDIQFLRKDGRIGWYALRTSALRPGGGEFIGMVSDISERVQAQMALQESLHRLQMISNQVPGMVYQYQMRPDGHGSLPYVSDAIREIYRVSPQEALADAGKLFESIHPDDLPGVLASIQRSAKDLSRWNHEYRLRFTDGVERWLLGSSIPQRDADGSVTWHGVVTDITQRKAIEEELAAHRVEVQLGVSRQRLRDLVVQNERLREDDRKSLAREVHDELGQVLAGIRMSLLLMEIRYCALDPGLATLVSNMKTLLDRGIQGVRDVVTHLRPVALDLGLIPAIESLCAEFSIDNQLEFVLDTSEQEILLDEARLIVVFRIIQESITNIIRHSRASRVDIGLTMGSQLEVEVRDNGLGFDVTQARKKKSFGLLGMQERAIALGGHVEIESAPGRGAAVRLVVPLKIDFVKVMQ